MEQFFTNLINPILQALVMFLVPMLIAYGVRLFRNWTGVQINVGTEQMLRDIAMSAVSHVEEVAANSLKTGAVKWTSSMKHGAAIDLILAKVPSLTHEQASRLVTSAVGMIPSIGASAVSMGQSIPPTEAPDQVTVGG